MATNAVVAKKLGYEVKKKGSAYWFHVKQFSPACLNPTEKFRVLGPFDSRAEANQAAVAYYWNLVHADPNMYKFVWTPN